MNTLSDVTYRLKLKKGDYEVDVQGDKAWVENKFKELTESELAKATSQVSSISSAKALALPETLAEFLITKGNPKQHSTLVVIFGYWLLHKENQKSFNLKDIASCYDDVRIPESSNTNQCMNDAQSKGLLKRLDEKKDNQTAWTITQRGDEFVEQELWKTSVKKDSQGSPLEAGGEEKGQKQDGRGGLRSSVISPAIDTLLEEGFFKEFKNVDEVCEELKRKAVPVADTHTVNEALKRRVSKTLDRIKNEQGKWMYRKKS